MEQFIYIAKHLTNKKGIVTITTFTDVNLLEITAVKLPVCTSVHGCPLLFYGLGPDPLLSVQISFSCAEFS